MKENKNNLTRIRGQNESASKNINTLISFLFIYRTFVDKSKPVGHIKSILDDILNSTDSKDHGEFEILIKIDADDETVVKAIYEDKLLEKYPFPIHYFMTHRWEGRLSFHQYYQYIYPYINPSSKFISFLTADCRCQKPEDRPGCQGFRTIFDFLKQVPDNKYTIYTNKKWYPGSFEDIRDYIATYKIWYEAGYTEPFPIIPVHIMNICGNFGNHSCSETWVTLLGIIMYVDYGLSIFKNHSGFIEIDNIGEHGIEMLPIKSLYPLSLCDSWIKNLSYFSLVKQQAKNIYLNLKAKEILG